MFVTRRLEENPILHPDKNKYWEGFATFNMCPIKKGEDTIGVYRALSVEDKIKNPRQVSTVGIARSKDGIHFEDRKQLIKPKEEWEKYGCEDPRITYFEGKYYIFYTALSEYPFAPEGIKVAVAVSENLETVNERHLVTPFNSKAMALFPERVNGKVTVVFSSDTDTPPAKMNIVFCNDVSDLWSSEFWEKWQLENKEDSIDPRRTEHDHIEVGAPPVKTDKGWLLVYSHIQNYFNKPENSKIVFGVEAVMLDLEDPRKIIGRTKGPIIAPSEPYELSGYIKDVIFPSGAMIEKEDLEIYYGAADTTVCVANVNLNDLVFTMMPETQQDYSFKRFKGNPIIEPGKNSWEELAVFNPAAINLNDGIHLLYRAMSLDNTSVMGYAKMSDPFTVEKVLSEPAYVPREDFEGKGVPGGNSGCEDPRLTKIDDKVFVCYTAYNGLMPPRVAMSYIDENDFINNKWENWSKPVIITPQGLDDKDACLLPKKFSDGYYLMHRVSNEICGDYLEDIEGEVMVKKCIRVLGPRENMWDSAKVGITAPPIKTDKGWLLLYHGVSKSNSTYRVGAALLDLEDPSIVLARCTDPVFNPEEDYEKIGIINNVVFPCGMIQKDGVVYIYYGGADKVVGVATMKLSIIMDTLTRGL